MRNSSEIIARAVEIRNERRLLDADELIDIEQVADLRIAFGDTDKERRDGLVMLELLMHIKAVTKGNRDSNQR